MEAKNKSALIRENIRSQKKKRSLCPSGLDATPSTLVRSSPAFVVRRILWRLRGNGGPFDSENEANFVRFNSIHLNFFLVEDYVNLII